MHGRPRNPTKPEDEASSSAKASKLRTLQSQFLHFHHTHNYEKEAMEISAKLLEINPEFYTAWNYRKLAVDHSLSQPGSDPESILNAELRLVETALRRNFKSYGAWHHRKWVLSKGQSPVHRELDLLKQFEKLDARNFHAWNYRRFVAALNRISEEVELKHTTVMIDDNFSNYSAWHNRSVILSNLLERKAEGFFPKEKFLTEEYEQIHPAIFTDPDDQSGWFYHLWLVEETVKKDSPWLISSWPASELLLVSDPVSSPFTSYSRDGRTIPLILCFSEPVRGVNSSTVSVTSALAESKDLIWRPLSSNKYEGARTWVALLRFADVQIDYSKVYPVEVNLQDSAQIVSLSGCPLIHDFQSKFDVHFRQPDAPQEEQILRCFSWEDSMFLKYEAVSQDSSLIPPFKQLKINKNKEGDASKWQLEILASEIEVFRLLAADWKIGKLTLARLLTALDTMLQESSTIDSCEISHNDEILGLYSDLMNMDAPHLQYYKEQHSLVFMQQATCSIESLLRYCWCCKNCDMSNSRVSVCLRLNNQSLARIGSIERLLWVQMLDLSHNELQSIEGLEAMQLLSCLNLSCNKIKSFTALDPLRHLKLLQVLNIAHNEIGNHSIDTTRYLSHTVTSDRKPDPSSISDALLKRYWEAFLIFRDTTLIQLDIAGNAVDDDDFRSFLRKVIPTLKWLDSINC